MAARLGQIAPGAREFVKAPKSVSYFTFIFIPSRY
jgi:hypothetical protein